MNKNILLTTALASLAAAAALMNPRDETAPRPVESAAVAMPSAVDLPRPVAAARPAAEVIEEFDTTGLLQESPSVEEFLALADAAADEPLSDGDRARLAAALRSDPELRKQFHD